MDRATFLNRLELALLPLSPDERSRELAQCAEKFDAAGPMRETEILAELGEPEKLAAEILNKKFAPESGAADKQDDGVIELTLNPMGIDPICAEAEEAARQAEFLAKENAARNAAAQTQQTQQPPQAPEAPVPPMMYAEQMPSGYRPKPQPKSAKPIKTNVSGENQAGQKKKVSTGAIVAAVLTSPIWVPLGLAAIALAFSLIVTLFAVIVSLIIAGVGIAVGGVAAVIYGLWKLVTGMAASALMLVGGGLIVCGIGVLIAVAFGKLSKAVLPNMWHKFTGSVKRPFKK